MVQRIAPSERVQQTVEQALTDFLGRERYEGQAEAGDSVHAQNSIHSSYHDLRTITHGA